MVSFNEVVEQWKAQHAEDTKTYSMKYYVLQENAWKPYRSSHFGFDSANFAALHESNARPERLIGISHKGEMQALYSEGKCIWTKE